MADAEIVRYGKKLVNLLWDPLPRNTDSSGAPIVCLGQIYDSRPISPFQDISQPSASSPSDTSAAKSNDTSSDVEEISKAEVETEVAASNAAASQDSSRDEGGWPPTFLDDFESRLWFTYRSNFPPIPKSQDPKALANMSFAVRIRQLASQEGFTSDTGWGCMIRSGQSLLANTLSILKLGRDWRIGLRTNDEKQLISLFADDPKAPFSIHKFVEHGAIACGKYPGEWFGPSATATCIRALVNEHEESQLSVYITEDGSSVFEDAIFKLAQSKSGKFQPVLILVGTRLGLDRITPIYQDALSKSLQMPQSVGIAGGRPSSSHYFVGTQNSDFFYLDPHNTRTALPLFEKLSEYTEDDIRSCHTRRLRRININEMDPSMLIGFLIKSEDDWEHWRDQIAAIPGKSIVHITGKEPDSYVMVERPGAIDEVETLDTEDEAFV